MELTFIHDASVYSNMKIKLHVIKYLEIFDFDLSFLSWCCIVSSMTISYSYTVSTQSSMLPFLRTTSTLLTSHIMKKYLVLFTRTPEILYPSKEQWHSQSNDVELLRAAGRPNIWWALRTANTFKPWWWLDEKFKHTWAGTNATSLGGTADQVTNSSTVSPNLRHISPKPKLSILFWLFRANYRWPLECFVP